MASMKQADHVCIKCYEANQGYVQTKHLKICEECGGTVLFVQEAGDKIAELDSEIRSLRERYGIGGYD